MPIITFTNKDKLAAIVMDPGWQKTIMTKLDGPKESQSKKSMSFYCDLLISGGPYDGKEITVCFNTGVNSSSMLNGIQYIPFHQMQNLIAACLKKKVSEIPAQLNTDDILNVPFDGKWDMASSEGAVYNMLVSYLPAGAGAAAPAF